MNNFTIYTDGSYRSSLDQGGIGVVWLKNGEFVQEYSKGFKGTTNNIMELLAIKVALASIKKEIDSLTIISDSEYAIGCISNPKWNPKKNRELIQSIKNLLEEKQKLVKSPIKFEHTYGHQKNDDEHTKWNNRCDKLCTTASSIKIV